MTLFPDHESIFEIDQPEIAGNTNTEGNPDTMSTQQSKADVIAALLAQIAEPEPAAAALDMEQIRAIITEEMAAHEPTQIILQIVLPATPGHAIKHMLDAITAAANGEIPEPTKRTRRTKEQLLADAAATPAAAIADAIINQAHENADQQPSIKGDDSELRDIVAGNQAAALDTVTGGAGQQTDEEQLDDPFADGEEVSNFRFPLGQCRISPEATAIIDESGESPSDLLYLHQILDPGSLDEDEIATRLQSLAGGSNIFSEYKLSTGKSISIVTTADREHTHIVLPSQAIEEGLI